MKKDILTNTYNSTDEILMRILQLVSSEEETTTPDEDASTENDEPFEIDPNEMEEVEEEEEGQLFHEEEENIETVKDYSRHFYFAYK